MGVLISARHDADNWNKLKNMASKAIGEKMKVYFQHNTNMKL